MRETDETLNLPKAMKTGFQDRLWRDGGLRIKPVYDYSKNDNDANDNDDENKNSNDD